MRRNGNDTVVPQLVPATFFKKKEKYQLAELRKVENGSKTLAAKVALADTGLLLALSHLLFWDTDDMLPSMSSKAIDVYSDIVLVYSSSLMFRQILDSERPFVMMVLQKFTDETMAFQDPHTVENGRHRSLKLILTWVRIMRNFSTEKNAREDLAVAFTFKALFSFLSALDKAAETEKATDKYSEIEGQLKANVRAGVYALTAQLLDTESGATLFCTVNPTEYLQHWLFALDQV
jgi:hypothetical protein